MMPSRLLSPARWAWRHKWLSSLVVVLLGLLLVNVLAFLHARAMTHFAAEGNRTAKPEALSLPQKVGVLLAGVTIPRPQNDRTPAAVDLAFDVQTIDEDDGTILEAWHIPPAHADPRAVVTMFHSYAASKSRLLQEARFFHDVGYAIVLVDFRGSGGSSGNVTTVGVREADDVAATTAHARNLYPNAATILYGQSMGSAAILRALAVRGVAADAVIIECPFDRLVTTVGNRFHAMGLPAYPGAPLLVFWGGVQCGFNGFAHNPTDYARDVTCPVLLLHGTADPRVSVEQVRSVFDNLGGEKRLELLDGAGHQPYVDTHPERWKRTVAEFLEERLRGRDSNEGH